MNDFKVGDAVWVVLPKYKNPSSTDIHPYAFEGIIKDLPTEFAPYYFIQSGPTYDGYREKDIFASKNEAIDAMIKHLEGMKNDKINDIFYSKKINKNC